ncbi:velvet factor-domain-containing protein [Aspergillus aurantiobrunneus]
MTTYAGPQNADLYRLGQKPVLIAENSIQTCEARLFQMSGTPFQQWTYNPDGRYTNARAYMSDEDRQRQTAVSNPPCLTQEPPRFLLPSTQGYEPTMMQNAHHTRLPGPGRAWDRSDSKYKFPPTTTGSLAQYSIQRPSMSRGVEHAGPSSSYYDSSSRSHGFIGSTSRINDVESQYSSSSATFPSPVHSDKSPVSYSAIPHPSDYKQLPMHQRHSIASMPSGFENLLHHPTAPSHPPLRKSSSSRYRLFIRQQPIAARACGAGDRDRRPVDPPPIIQLLLKDFNPGSEKDKSTLQDPRFTVGCLLYPVQDSSWSLGSSKTTGRQESTNLGLNLEDSNAPGQSTPLLSGKAFVSPFYVDKEPDPDSAPPHPSNSGAGSETTKALARNSRGGPGPASPMNPPASFFIFSDLSVRTAGLYRLQFRLMNWGAVEDTGQSMPILAEAWSEPFRVYAAKDFPGMRDSSLLTVRLKELGFVELKTRGKGMGKGRRVGKGDLKGLQE